MAKVLEMTEETSRLFKFIFEAALKYEKVSSLDVKECINRIDSLVRDEYEKIDAK